MMPDPPPLRELRAVLRTDPRRYTELVRDIRSYGIYLIDGQAQICSWNIGAAQITGLAEREVLGRPWERLYTPADRAARVPGSTLEFVRRHGHFHGEQTRLRADGGALVCDVTLERVRADDGRLIGYLEIVQDITERKQREEALYRQATRDALTGVFNRGHFTALGEQELERARRFSEPLSIALLDIDHFKSINDTYGHEIGDQAIIALARTCQANVRNIDTIGRLGGEEFAILFPRAALSAAHEMSNRLRLAIAQTRMPLPPGSERPRLSYTVSIGVAALSPQVADLKELLRNADATLYRSKREGRNRVTAWQD